MYKLYMSVLTIAAAATLVGAFASVKLLESMGAAALLILVLFALVQRWGFGWEASVRSSASGAGQMQVGNTDMRIAQAVNILKTGGQRQDSLSDQLDDLMRLARATGCYDAMDFIERVRDQASIINGAR